VFFVSSANAQGNNETLTPKSSSQGFDSELYQMEIAVLLEEGVAQMHGGKYHQAYSMFRVGFEKAQQDDSVRLSILLLNNLGNIFYYLNNPDSSLTFYYQALDLAKENDLLSFQNTINNNIGIMYSSTGHPEKAYEFINKALAVSILQKDTIKMAINLGNLGVINTEMGNLTEAHGNQSQAKAYFKQMNNKSSLSSLYDGIGELFYKEENYDSALVNFKLGIALLDEGEFTNNKLSLYINVGKTLIALNEFDSAEIFLEQAYKKASKDGLIENSDLALSWLIISNKKQGNIERAFELSQQSNLLKDSIILKERKDIIEESRIKYDFTVKEREYELEKKNAINKQFYWRLLIIGLVIIIVLLAIILRARIKTAVARREKLAVENKMNLEKLSVAKLKNKELKSEISSIEEESLKTQHDLENQLESVNYELISKSLLIENKNQVLDTIDKLVKDAEAGLVDDSNSHAHIQQLKQSLVRDNMMDQNWEHFKLYFERVHADFFKNIHSKHSNLTSSDLRLSAFLLLQFNSKEIAQILNITPESVRKRKQRIKEKMELDKNSDLLKYLYTFTV